MYIRLIIPPTKTPDMQTNLKVFLSFCISPLLISGSLDKYIFDSTLVYTLGNVEFILNKSTRRSNIV